MKKVYMAQYVTKVKVGHGVNSKLKPTGEIQQNLICRAKVKKKR